MWKLVSAIILSVSLAGCASTSSTIPCSTIPISPELPKIAEEEYSCLSDETYNSFVERDITLKEHNAKLEAILYTYCE